MQEIRPLQGGSEVLFKTFPHGVFLNSLDLDNDLTLIDACVIVKILGENRLEN